MATIPVPRSFSQIEGQMINALLSKLGLTKLQIGNPALSIIEAAAQSDLRSSQDIFQMLDSQSLDRATGLALDNIGADEDTARIGQTPSVGTLTVSDTSFTKISSKIFPGASAPIVGSATLNVTDASLFPASGAVYVGRGTVNYEGPLTYTSKVNMTNFWVLNLAGGSHTQKYHNLNESVIVAQGGNRLIAAGTLAQTPQGNTSLAIQFSTQYDATIPDGEVSIGSVPAIATQEGTIGNVPAGTVNSFVTPPFPGATVTNDTPFTNGLDNEDDNTYRERIRDVRQSRSRGTPLALTTAVLGITALDENKRVISASVVTRDNFPTTLYIDDGTGYEEITGGVAYEVLVDDALGGEQYFQLAQGRPVSKAQDITLLSAPYNLQVSTLAVLVGGVLSEHTFSASDFRAISNASAFEVATSINANSTLSFQAKPTNNGTQVALSAKADTNEDIQVVSPGPGFIDANQFLGFPAGRVDTLRLYKNDRLLSKDGQVAAIVGNAQGLWGAMSSPQTLALTVDGIPLVDGVTPGFITLTDADFVNAGTGFATLSAGNSIASWAAVLNFRVPGITCTVSGDSLVLTSNRGRSALASVQVNACDLVTNGVFNVGTSVGLNSDYTLDRNLGQIRLNDDQILAVGDRLTAGSLETRAFLESTDLGSVSIAALPTSEAGQTGAELWFDVDGDAQILKSSLGAGTGITFTATVESWGKRVRLTAASTVFANAQHGDWIVIQDQGISQPNRGAYRIATVDPSFFWVEVEQPSTWASAEVDTLQTGAITLVRTAAQLQRVFVQDSVGSGTTYTATSFVGLLNAQLISATAEVFRTNRIRVRTDEFETPGGTIALVATNAEGVKLGLPVSSAVLNENSHLASQLSGNPDTGTPSFQVAAISSVVSEVEFILSGLAGGNSGSILVALAPKPDTGPILRESNNGHVSTIDNIVPAADVTVRLAAIENWLPADRIYPASPYSISPQDQLAVVIDGDTASKRFVQNMFRQGGTVGSTYGITMTLTDAAQGGISLAESFGVGMNWQDFAVFMPARVKSDSTGGVDTTSTVLWRYKRLGPDGNDARIAYGYPVSASEAVLVKTNTFVDAFVDISVLLPSGAARGGTSLRTTSRIGVAVTAGPDGNSLYDYQHVFNFLISSASREQRLDYTGKVGGGWTAGETITGGTSGATATIQVVGGAPGGASGSLILTAVAGAFVNGETITGGTSASTAVVSGTIYGVSKLTLTLPGAITVHGLSIGNVIWTQSTDVNFTTGAFTILEVPSGTQINYRENTNAVGATPNIGTLSFDNQGEVSAGASVIVGDIQSIVGGSFPANFQQAIKLTVANAHNTLGKSPTASGTTTTLSWYLAGVNVSFFPLDAGGSTIDNIAAAVNAQASSSVTAVPVGVGGVHNGVITNATYEAASLGGANPWWYLSDGLNWVRSTNTPGLPTTNFVFTLKDAVTASLATNSDWANERVYLVPITAANIVNFLNTPGPGGLFASAELEVADQGRHPQIASLTPGSVGSVQVQGGAANFLSAAVQGSAVDVASTYAVVTIDAADGANIYATNWVRLQNAIAVPKANIDANTTLTSIVPAGTVIYNAGGTKAWSFANAGAAPITGLTWQIEKQGRFVAFFQVAGAAANLSGVKEGDWVHVGSALGGTVSSRNQGLFRLVRIDNTAKAFWVENTNALEETATADLGFLTYDSVVPGDKLVINTAVWGLGNIGTWTVASIDLSTYNVANTNNQWKYALNVTTRAPVSAGPVAALGAQASLIQILEASPSSLIKEILTVSPNAGNTGLVDVKFTTDAGFTKVTEAAGTILLSLDKLGFPISTATGIDGYRHSLGLIEESNKVAYGLESDPTTFPGIVAAGANVNIEGPLVRRVQVSLALRVQSGINSTDIINQVQSAVASTVNQTGVGQPVAISSVVDAAMSVNGVTAVTVLSPTYGPGNDLISVQPFEKALVLNLADDVLVSFVGT